MRRRKKRRIQFFLIISIIAISIFYYISNIKSSKKEIHFSIDDTIGIFKDLTEHHEEYDTIFDNQTLKFFKEMNEKYNMKISLYCFYKNEEFDLSQCTDKYQKEFENNSDWLKFGFHAYENQSDYEIETIEESNKQYEDTINELQRIVGKKSITKLVRAHRFSGNKEIIKKFMQNKLGVTGLFGAETEGRQNYYLDNEQNNILYETGKYYDEELKLQFHTTDIRVENTDDIKTVLNEKKEDNYLVIYTNEWMLSEEGITEKIKEICEFAITNNIEFSI